MASSFAAKRLCSAFLREIYLGLWMSARDEKLRLWCSKHFDAIRSPSEYMGLAVSLSRGELSATNATRDVTLPFHCELHTGDLDYNLGRLAKLDKVLTRQKTRLFLMPHIWTGGKKPRLGTLSGVSAEAVEMLCQKVASSRCFRFRKDRVLEEDAAFWDRHLLKLQLAVNDCLARLDSEMMEMFLRVLVEPVEALRTAWTHRPVRDCYSNNVRRASGLVFFYLTVVRQVLAFDHWPVSPHEGHQARFVGLVFDSVRDRVHGLFQHADYHTLQFFVELIPRMYEALLEAKPATSSELWQMRGQLGGFYAFCEGLFDELPADTPQEDKERMRLVLHEGIFRWLVIAINKRDRELVDSLCSAAGRLVHG